MRLHSAFQRIRGQMSPVIRAGSAGRGRPGLARARAGNVAIIVGAALAILVGAAGVAIDGGRAWLMRSRLATSLDAAAVAVARSYSTGADVETALRPIACQVFWANFGRNGGETPCAAVPGSNASCSASNNGSPGPTARGYLGAMAGQPSVLVSADGTVTVSVSATLDTTVMNVLGAGTVSTCSAASAQRSVNAVEVALAVDISGSMYEANKMPALRDAATNFVASLMTRSSGAGRTWISLVPYGHSVNIGPANSAMVNPASIAQFGGLNDSRGTSFPVSWSGCVLARSGPLNGTMGDLTDFAPNAGVPNSLFNAWFFPSTLDNTNAALPLYWYSQFANGTGTRTYVTGVNDWRGFLPGQAAVNAHAINEWALNIGTPRQRNDAGPIPPRNFGDPNQNPLDITGPNYGCMLESRYRVQPLTADQATLNSRIAALEADPWSYHWKVSGIDATAYGGTILHLGLHTAWLTVSPRMNGLWAGAPSSLPLTGAAAGTKAVVIMTDGVNAFPNYAFLRRNGVFYVRGAPDGCFNGWTAAQIPDNAPRRTHDCVRDSTSNRQFTLRTSTYGPYGRLNEGNLAVTNGGVPTGLTVNDLGSAQVEVDRRFVQICTSMKNAGVQVFVVGFDIASAVAQPSNGVTYTENDIRSRLQSCSNDPATHYVEATNAAGLNAAFQRVADSLGRIRLVR